MRAAKVVLVAVRVACSVAQTQAQQGRKADTAQQSAAAVTHRRVQQGQHDRGGQPSLALLQEGRQSTKRQLPKMRTRDGELQSAAAQERRHRRKWRRRPRGSLPPALLTKGAMLTPTAVDHLGSLLNGWRHLHQTALRGRAAVLAQDPSDEARGLSGRVNDQAEHMTGGPANEFMAEQLPDEDSTKNATPTSPLVGDQGFPGADEAGTPSLASWIMNTLVPQSKRTRNVLQNEIDEAAEEVKKCGNMLREADIATQAQKNMVYSAESKLHECRLIEEQKHRAEVEKCQEFRIFAKSLRPPTSLNTVLHNSTKRIEAVLTTNYNWFKEWYPEFKKHKEDCSQVTAAVQSKHGACQKDKQSVLNEFCDLKAKSYKVCQRYSSCYEEHIQRFQLVKQTVQVLESYQKMEFKHLSCYQEHLYTSKLSSACSSILERAGALATVAASLIGQGAKQDMVPVLETSPLPFEVDTSELDISYPVISDKETCAKSVHTTWNYKSLRCSDDEATGEHDYEEGDYSEGYKDAQTFFATTSAAPTSSTAPIAGSWVLAEASQNCKNACEGRGLMCNEGDLLDHMPEVDSEDEIKNLMRDVGVECENYSNHFGFAKVVPEVITNKHGRLCSYSTARNASNVDCKKFTPSSNGTSSRQRLCWCSTTVASAREEPAPRVTSEERSPEPKETEETLPDSTASVETSSNSTPNITTASKKLPNAAEALRAVGIDASTAILPNGSLL